MLIFFLKVSSLLVENYVHRFGSKRKQIIVLRANGAHLPFLKKMETVFFTFQSFTLVRRLIGNVIQLKTVQMKTYLLPLQYLMLILVKFPSSIDHDPQTPGCMNEL